MNRAKSSDTLSSKGSGKRMSKSFLTNLPKNLLAQRKLNSTFIGLDKEKIKKVSEIDNTMKLTKLRQEVMSSKKVVSNDNLEGTFFVQPGFRFRRNGEIRQIESGYTDVQLQDSITIPKVGTGQACNVRHMHNDVCKIGSMTSEQVDAEIKRLTSQIKVMKKEADNVIAEHKLRSAHHVPQNYLHAHSNDFVADLEVSRRSEFWDPKCRHGGIRKNCTACYFDIKPTNIDSEMKRILTKENYHWTRWKIAPSGEYTPKTYVPTLLFFERTSPLKRANIGGPLGISQGRGESSSLDTDCIDKVFEANQVVVEVPSPLCLLEQVKSESSIKDSGILGNITAQDSDTRISQGVNPKRPSKRESLRKHVLTKRALLTSGQDMSPSHMRYAKSDNKVNASLATDAVGDYVASPTRSVSTVSGLPTNKMLKQPRAPVVPVAVRCLQRKSYSTPILPKGARSISVIAESVDHVHSATTAPRFPKKAVEKNMNPKTSTGITFPERDIFEEICADDDLAELIANMKLQRSVLEEEARRLSSTQYAIQSSDHTLTDDDRKQLLKAKAAFEMNTTLRKVNAFMRKIPGSEPVLKTWRTSAGHMSHFDGEKVSLHEPSITYADSVAALQGLAEFELNPDGGEQYEEDFERTKELQRTRSKPFISPWGRLNDADLEILEDKPNSIQSLAQCRYLRPYKMKTVDFSG